MKTRILSIALSVAAVLVTSACAKEAVELSGTCVKVSLDDFAKSTLGAADAQGVRKTYWQNGDKISINGVESEALSGVEEGCASVTFKFGTTLSYPYNVVYPASAYESSTAVILPSRQTYIENSFDPEAAIAVGYAAGSGQVNLKAPCAVLKLNLTSSEPCTLSNIIITGSNGEQLSGEFEMNCSAGTIAPASTADADKSVTVDVSALTLGTTGTDIYIVVPAGTYSNGFKVRIIDNNGREMIQVKASSVTLSAAKVYGLPSVEFVPTGVSNGIWNASDMQAFAQAVNDGGDISRFCNEAGDVVLMNDIDMSAVTSWTPIGAPTTVTNANTACSYTGPAFKGVFDGQDHCIYNFKQAVKVAANGTWGIFGVLDGATVKNLTLGKADDKISKVTISAAGQADAGILVGTLYNGASIQEVTNYIPLDVKGTDTDNKRMACGVFAGFMCSTDKASCLDKLVNCAPITLGSGKNTKNGATGVSIGAIAGFCTGAGTAKTQIENCLNEGDLTGACGRSSGIAATMNAKTIMRYCVNRGDQFNSFVNGRIANLTCIMGSGCVMDDCTNYGDVVTSDSQTTTAGMIALLNNDNVVVTGGGNYGKVIGGNEQYHGLLVANFSKFQSVSGVYVGGSCGTYSSDGNHKMHELNKDNWIKHIGSCSEANMAKVTKLSSEWGEGGSSTGGDLPELKDAGLRILFIGNSFTKDAVEHLPGICVAAGATGITMAHCYYGGRTIPEYYNDRAVANNTFYYANPGDKNFTTWSTKASIKAVAESGRWDVITIQEHTGNYRAWSWTADEKNAIQNLIDFVCATQTVKPKVYYIMSQAYYDMSKIGSGSQPSVTWTTQQGMYEVIVAQARKVLDETSVDDVIATGTMLQNLRTSKCNNADDLTRDGYHMDYGISRYGAACTVFGKIVGPATGKTLEGNGFRYSSTTAGTTNVTDANAPVAQKAAQYAVEKPFEITDMSEEGGDTPDPVVPLKGSGTESDPYLIENGEDMTLVGAALVEGETKHFLMTGDIDMSSITDWAPVNTENKAKNIVFDGANHKISGFKCTNKTYTSLFGLISGTVKNLVIDSPVVTNTAQLGVLATWLGNSNGSLKAEVSNVHVISASVSMTGTGAAAVGGIAANCGASTVDGCSVSATITHGCSGGSWNYVGGIVGRAYSTGTAISSCSFNGSIEATANKGYGFGGILGGSGADVAVTVVNCMSEGSISGVSYAGGIVGELCKASKVKDCYSTMSISGIYNLAGIVGRASNGKNPNSDANVHFDSDLGITVSGCIAWTPSIVSTNRASETPASHYSSAAVVGFTVYKNKLDNCYRRPEITFSVYKDELAQYNVLSDTADVSPDAPLVKPGSLTYLCPYNGKAAKSSDTVSSLAKTLGWDTAVWNLDADMPVLK